MIKTEKILAAAQNLFGRYGVRRVTTDDIAREARVSKTTIYRQFDNKHEILGEVIRREWGDLRERIQEAIAAQQDSEGRLRAYLTTKITDVRDLINLYQLTSDILADNWDPALEMKREVDQEELALIRGLLEDGIRAGDLTVADPDATAHFIMLSVRALEKPWALGGMEISIARQVELMVNLTMNGLRTRP